MLVTCSKLTVSPTLAVDSLVSYLVSQRREAGLACDTAKSDSLTGPLLHTSATPTSVANV